MGDHDLAAHGVHHHEDAVLAVAQVADFQLTDFVGQADGERVARLAIINDFIQNDAARGLEAVVAAKQVCAAFLTPCEEEEAAKGDE